MKKIITHINPDIDAVTSVWLIKKFLPGWKEAEVGFTEANLSVEKMAEVDEDPEILYVDVGRGRLDHHQTSEELSASKLCWNYIKNNRGTLNVVEEKATERLVEVINQVDNARDLNWEEVGQDRYQFYLHNLIDGWRGLALSDMAVVDEGFKMLDAVLLRLKNKIKAEEEMTKGIVFKTKLGKGIAAETGNKQFLWHSQSQGFVIAIFKDPKTGGVRIHARPDSTVDFTFVYNKVKELDPQSDWFLHASKKLLLNQASVNPNMRPTKLSLKEIIKVLKNND